MIFLLMVDHSVIHFSDPRAGEEGPMTMPSFPVLQSGAIPLEEYFRPRQGTKRFVLMMRNL